MAESVIEIPNYAQSSEMAVSGNSLYDTSSRIEEEKMRNYEKHDEEDNLIDLVKNTSNKKILRMQAHLNKQYLYKYRSKQTS